MEPEDQKDALNDQQCENPARHGVLSRGKAVALDHDLEANDGRRDNGVKEVDDHRVGVQEVAHAVLAQKIRMHLDCHGRDAADEDVHDATHDVAVDEHVLQVEPDFPLPLARRQGHRIFVQIVEPAFAKADLHANDEKHHHGLFVPKVVANVKRVHLHGTGYCVHEDQHGEGPLSISVEVFVFIVRRRSDSD